MEQIKDFWTKKHKDYLKQDWINQPSIFSMQVLEYLPGQGKLLELAAGQGQDSRFFAKNGYDVWCTDFNQYALSEAKKKSKQENVLMNYQMIDIGQVLPFEDSSFAVVYSHMGLHFFDRKKTRKLFEEICRVLKKGGIFASIFNTIEDPEKEDGRMKKIDDHFYQSDLGLTKSYFSIGYIQKLIQDLFETVLLDDCGQTYKDAEKNLIRFVGRKFSNKR